MASKQKRPAPDLVIRMVGSDVRPWAVPMRRLATALQAAQALMVGSPISPDDEEDELIDGRTDEEAARAEGAGEGFLYLLDVVARSATYPVGTKDRDHAIRVLRETSAAIEDPESSHWSPAMLDPIRSLSNVARALGCQIEFRFPGEGRNMGDVIATIGPATYQRISEAAFVSGDTSVYGKVERVGGVTAMRCGLRVPEQPNRIVICSVASQELVQQLGQHLYQYVVVSGRATWFRRDWRLKRMDIWAFEPPKTGSILATLDRAHKAGGHAWDNIEDPRSYLSELRG